MSNQTAAGEFFLKDKSPVTVVTAGNEVHFLIDGKALIMAVAEAISQPETTHVWIAGWAITPYLRLVRENIPAGQPDTLVDLIKSKPSIDFRVLLYDSIWNGPLDLADEKVEVLLEEVGAYVLRHRPAAGNAHHGKFIVINRGKSAFVGGIDLFQGRWDIPKHPLTPMVSPYNPAPTTPDRIDPNNPFDAYNAVRASGKALTRMPWHDVSMRVRGPAAHYVAVAFAERWKAAEAEHAKLLGAIVRGGYERAAHRALNHGMNIDWERGDVEANEPPSPDRDKGGKWVQMVRSTGASVEDVERGPYDAYRNAIEHAHYYIYIENQYFISRTDSTPFDGFPENNIAKLIVKRVRAARRLGEPFHVFVVVPLFPEGQLHPMTKSDYDEVIKTATRTTKRAHWLYRVVERGIVPAKRVVDQISEGIDEIDDAINDTLDEWNGRGVWAIADWTLPRLRRLVQESPEGQSDAGNPSGWVASLQQQLKSMGKYLTGKAPDISTLKSKAEALERKVSKLLDITHGSTILQLETLRYLKSECREYISIYYLRAYAKDILMDSRPVTETIYVHSKIMIVDDSVAIVGSANMFDRSLLGNRDSELSGIVADGDTVLAPIAGELRHVRPTVRKFRNDLWSEHFGSDLVLDDPLGKELSTVLQMDLRATLNQMLFESMFSVALGRSTDGRLDIDPSDADVASLDMVAGIKGHAHLFPMSWLKEEKLTPAEEATRKQLSREEDVSPKKPDVA